MTVTALASRRTVPGDTARPASKPARRPTTAQRTILAREARVRRLMRTVAISGATPVAVVAMVISYFHITSMAVRYGQSQSSAHLLPIAIDGLMIVASVATIAHRQARLPRVAFGVGTFATSRRTWPVCIILSRWRTS